MVVWEVIESLVTAVADLSDILDRGLPIKQTPFPRMKLHRIFALFADLSPPCHYTVFAPEGRYEGHKAPEMWRVGQPLAQKLLGDLTIQPLLAKEVASPYDGVE